MTESTATSTTSSTSSNPSVSGATKHKHTRRKSVVDIITDILHQDSDGKSAQTPHQLRGETEQEKRTLFRNPTLAASMLKKKLEHEKRKSIRQERHHGHNKRSSRGKPDSIPENSRVSYTSGGTDDENSIASPVLQPKIVGLHHIAHGTIEKRTSDIAGIGSASNYYSNYSRSGRAERHGSRASSASGTSVRSISDAWDASNGKNNDDSPIKHVS